MPELAGEVVADAFAGRATPRARGATLSPLAVRSYETRGRERPETECSVRTPFQRDRDRILHSKPFRRLKGKTQVFIDPAGDHYRTRMTHTLETTGIARVVARALRLNEDLDRSDRPRPRHRPSAVRPCGRGGARRARRRRLPAQRAVGPHRTAAESDPRSRSTASSATPGHASRRRSRARSSASSTGSPTSITTSTTRFATASSTRATCRGTRSRSSGRPARSGSTRSSTISSSSRRRPGDIVQSDEIGAAMLSLRAFMFERVYVGPDTKAEHERAETAIAADLRAPAARGDSRRDHRVHRGHDRPVRTVVRCEPLVMARIKDTIVEAVKAAADFVEVVEDAHPAAQGRRPLHRPLPVSRGAHAVASR